MSEIDIRKICRLQWFKVWQCSFRQIKSSVA
nr:MAG TPA: hypothetical protein [Bacteriophage sp.]